MFDLAAYLREHGITHVLAHPLFSVNHKLTIEHFERCLLIFKNLELNGARIEEQNKCLQLLLSVLTPETMEQLAEKHGLTPACSFPWIKNVTGGSDDHSSLTIARRYTEIPGPVNVAQFLRGIEQGTAKVAGLKSTPKTLAHNVYSVAYQFYQHKFFKFFERFLEVDQESHQGVLARLSFLWKNGRRHKRSNPTNASVLSVLRDETHRLIWDDPQLAEIFKNGNGSHENLEDQWFRFVTMVSNKVLGQSAASVELRGKRV